MRFTNLFKKLNDREMSRAELAALRISMLIAALDGSFCDEEIVEFEKLAKSFTGYSKETTDKAFADTLRSAGYLMLLARVSSQDKLLDAFVIEADMVLPMFTDFGPNEIKHAVEIWRDMANADGEFWEIERLAIERLEGLLKQRYQVLLNTVALGSIGGNGLGL